MGLALVNKLSFEELNQIVSESFSLKEVVSKVGYSANLLKEFIWISQ